MPSSIPRVRAGISVFAQVPREQVQRGIETLSRDLGTGHWRERHRDRLELEQLHLGYYVVVAKLAGGAGRAD